METEKQVLRREIAREKKTHAEAQLGAWSDEICRAVEKREAFRQARCVACYHALPGEVQTEAFLNRWCGAKRMLLPRVEGDDLRLYPYTGPESVRRGAYGIWEPVAEGDPVPFEAVDLVIVPGVAFDREFARSQGLRVQLLEYVLMMFIALTIVACLRMVGIVLVISLLTIPQMTANLFSQRFAGIIWLSIGIGYLSCLGGLYLSFRENIPSGASIIFFSILIYALCKGGKNFVRLTIKKEQYGN